MNQGPICAKVYPEGIQPIKGNNCGLIPAGLIALAKISCERRSSGSKEHIKETKIADSVLLSLFMCCNVMDGAKLPTSLAQASAELYFQTDSE